MKRPKNHVVVTVWVHKGLYEDFKELKGRARYTSVSEAIREFMRSVVRRYKSVKRYV